MESRRTIARATQPEPARDLSNRSGFGRLEIGSHCIQPQVLGVDQGADRIPLARRLPQRPGVGHVRGEERPPL